MSVLMTYVEVYCVIVRNLYLIITGASDVYGDRCIAMASMSSKDNLLKTPSPSIWFLILLALGPSLVVLSCIRLFVGKFLKFLNFR